MKLKTFEFSRGNCPILVSMPHNGIALAPEMTADMTASALNVADTDWYMERIYHFATAFGCSLIKPVFSRYVIDLNRPEDNRPLYPGADTTELCPTTQFDGRAIYLAGKEPTDEQINKRLEDYWRPYHRQLAKTLQQIHSEYGYALLFEAHSIKSVVPRFFEGQLADFNFGNFAEKSSSVSLTQLINDWQPEGYSKVFNGRFKGGYITRHYADPEQGIDSLQLELSQATYMDEEQVKYDKLKAGRVITVIEDLFKNIIENIPRLTQNIR